YFLHLLMLRPPPTSTLFLYTTLFRSQLAAHQGRQLLRFGLPRRRHGRQRLRVGRQPRARPGRLDLLDDPQYLGERDRAQLLAGRSEEHTSELQSLAYLVCRLLLEKKN